MALAEREAARRSRLPAASNYELIFPEFQPAFDGLYAAAKVMELLAAERRALSELVDQLPAVAHGQPRRVPCPWDRKGLVMRALHDESHGENVRMIDGIRIGRDGGWVLVLPDASDPIFNVYAEGDSSDGADRHAEELAQRIEVLARG